MARPGHDLTSALQDCYDAFMKADHVMEGLFDQCPERHLQLLAYIHVSMARFLVRQADGRHHPLNHLRGAIITDLEDGITLTWLMGPVESISGAYKRTVSESKGAQKPRGAPVADTRLAELERKLAAVQAAQDHQPPSTKHGGASETLMTPNLDVITPKRFLSNT